MVATQPTINQVYDLASMLSWQEQRELIHMVQGNIRQSSTEVPITREELLTRVERADAMIDKGHFISHDEAKRHFQSRMARKAECI